jgi:hypothetical protein
MDDTRDRREQERVAVAEQTNVGRYLAVTAVVLWLVTMLVLASPSLFRGLH